MSATTAGPDREHALVVLSSPVRRDILDTLANLPPVPTEAEGMTRSRGLTAGELGERLRLHVTTVRFHVDQLVAVGLVRAHDERGQVGRPKRRYTASPGPLPELRRTEPYQMLAELLVDVLQDGTVETAEEAGRRWLERHSEALLSDLPPTPARTRSEWFAKLGLLVDVLDDWGYAPEMTTHDAGHTAELSLHNCPLLELVGSNPDVACGVHRGIIRGGLEVLGEGQVDMSLVPMVQPSVCLARITTRNDLTPRRRVEPPNPHNPEPKPQDWGERPPASRTQTISPPLERTSGSDAVPAAKKGRS